MEVQRLSGLDHMVMYTKRGLFSSKSFHVTFKFSCCCYVTNFSFLYALNSPPLYTCCVLIIHLHMDCLLCLIKKLSQWDILVIVVVVRSIFSAQFCKQRKCIKGEMFDKANAESSPPLKQQISMWLFKQMCYIEKMWVMMCYFLIDNTDINYAL